MIMEEDVKYFQSIYINSDPRLYNRNLYLGVYLYWTELEEGLEKQTEKQEEKTRFKQSNMLSSAPLFVVCCGGPDASTDVEE